MKQINYTGITFLLFFMIISASECSSAITKSKTEVVETDNLPFPGNRMRKSTKILTSMDSSITPTVVSYTNFRDPLIKVNRIVFAFNNLFYRGVLIPLTKLYRIITPDPLEKCISNFFSNIKEPIYIVNHILQFNPKPLGKTLLRFGINSTFGLLGLFDPALSKFGIKKEETHIEDTLARYGFSYGIYLVLPIIGPSDVRNSISAITDHFMNPVTYLTDSQDSIIIQSSDYFQNFAPKAEQYTILHQKSKDPYIFFRNLYLQGVERDDDK